MSWFLVEEAIQVPAIQDVTVVVYQQDQVLWQGQVARSSNGTWIRLYMGYMSLHSKECRKASFLIFF